MFELERAGAELVCLDAASGAVEWTRTLPTPLFAGVTAVNDLVLTAGLNGVFSAFDQVSGEPIWSKQLGAGVNAPISIAGDLVVIAAATEKVAAEGTGSGEGAENAEFQVLALKRKRS
jgi:outer membrane protein assembly factor BamB